MKNTSTTKYLSYLLSALVLFLGGCGDQFWDPTQVGRFRPVPAVNVILDTLGVAEEAPSAWADAEDPRPVDVMVLDRDYAFGPGDIVRVSIFELLEERAPYINDFVITETGRISIIEVGTLQAEGLTETQLEEEIKQILSPGVLRDPYVTVTLIESERRRFSIYGDGVARPGRYQIPRSDFRLADAISSAGGMGQFNVGYVYVARPVTGTEAVTEQALPGMYERVEPELKIDLEKEMLEIIAPRARRIRQQKGALNLGVVVTSSEMVSDKELTRAALPEGFEQITETDKTGETTKAEVPEGRAKGGIWDSMDSAVFGEDAERIEWIFEEGRWVPVKLGRPRPEKPVTKKVPRRAGVELKEILPQEFGWEQIGTAGMQTRLIKIPADRLRAGDPRYNIVIKPGDGIHVPVDVVGEYFIYGNTNFQGAIRLTGRPITLKMAIAAAGGLGPLAWPKRCEVIRRIGESKEEIVMVDLDKIARGEQPDFFIKPLDLINVGTHPTARWRAVLRNAFRATYGFGFIYDRNFADRDYGTSRPLPNWF